MKNVWKSPRVGAILIFLLTIVAYLPAMRGGFIWDDASWTTRIGRLLRNVSGLRLMWCQPTALQQYYPLTGASFWLDYHLWGFWTLPYHVENILLHACAAILFWTLLRRLRVPGAWLAGAIFAVHPVMVESVAWITERKNVLSLVLYLGALLAYGRFTKFWKVESGPPFAAEDFPPRDWIAYALAFLLFLAALLAKAVAFSLPAVILLICWWKRGRIQWRADVLPTLPFFALAISLGLLTAWLEKFSVGAKGPEWAIPFPERCVIAGRALWFYVGKLAWPANLCFMYPRWQINAGSMRQWLYPITAVGTLLVLWCARARIGRGPAVGALFFVGALLPVVGFLDAFFMRYSFVCDHLVYLPSLGLIALAAALITRTSEHLHSRALLYGFAIVVLPFFAVLTWRQSAIYTNIETFWRDTLAKNPNAWMAHVDFGIELQKMGRTQEAIEHYEQALRIGPNFAETHCDLGSALAQLGREQEAIGQYEQAVRIKPDFAEAHCNLGTALAELGRVQEAIGQYEQAVRIKPDFADAHFYLGNALAQLGRVQEAIGQYEQAVRINPDLAEAHNRLGLALAKAGKLNEAIEQYNQAVRIKPDYAEAHFNLGVALQQTGRIQEAMRHWEDALRIRPDFAEVPYNLGVALEHAGKLQEAIGQYQRALRIDPNYAKAHNNLGAVLMRRGAIQEAMQHWEEALRIKPDFAEPHYNLGIALEKEGKIQEAIGQYEQAVKINPNYAAARSSLNRLRSSGQVSRE
ncbi:MAG TPA: tetratricopeptide repeat protein [Verrucomicrobiae bacterium]|nr:tetratricopeptide repeat protein [Verrucomicrobiae bacterium]